MYQDFNESLIIFNQKIYIKIMRCKIVRSTYMVQYYKVNQSKFIYLFFQFYIIVSMDWVF